MIDSSQVSQLVIQCHMLASCAGYLLFPLNIFVDKIPRMIIIKPSIFIAFIYVILSLLCVSGKSTLTEKMEEEKTYKVLITHYDVPTTATELLQEKGIELVINDERPYPTYEQIKAKAAGVDAILWASKFRLDKGIVDAAGPQMKTVATMSAGVNNIDVEYLKSSGIQLANTPVVVDDSTANMAILLAQSAGRRMLEGRNAILEETWTYGPQWLLGYDITGSTVGIVGLGGIGSTIAKRAKGYNAIDILYTGHKEKEVGKELGAKFVDLDTLLQKSDFVFASVPLTNETRGMFNKEAFNKMKKTGVFVNVSRGEIVNQDDLVEALKNKTIFAAGLDVMTPEPLPKDHVLLTLPNCILAPHIGTATYEARATMAQLSAQNILRGLGGAPMFTPVY